MSNFEFLKPILGDDLYKQFSEKMADSDGITLINANDGSYVPKAKFDTEIAAKKQYSQQASELSKQYATLTAQVEELERQLKEAQAEGAKNAKSAETEGANAKALQEKVEKLTADLESHREKIKENTALHDQIAQLNEAIASRDKTIDGIHKSTKIVSQLRSAGARNPEALVRMIDLDKITEEDGKMTGLDDQITALKSSDPYMFNGTPAPRGGVDGGANLPHDMSPEDVNRSVNDEIRRAAGRDV